ncbi:MAG: hypothetical protein HY671_07325 [Chloroflexi bacterium]|nr:hypothetical protein [Chloroflexota bacterium]
MARSDKKSLLRLGLWVFLALMVLEIIEYVTGVTVRRNWPILAALALPGAGLIIYYFMHIPQLWRGEE